MLNIKRTSACTADAKDWSILLCNRIMLFSFYSETGPDTPAGDSPDIASDTNWPSKPPTGDTVSTAIRERPTPQKGLSAISEGRRLLGGRTPPQTRGAKIQHKPSITLL